MNKDKNIKKYDRHKYYIEKNIRKYKMKLNKTKNTIRNMIWGVINKIIVIIIPFLMRTLIIKVLGSEYLGLNSLFTSILQILNLTELGFSSAIVYSMYKPIAENDTQTMCALLNLYKKVYRYIGIIILIVGLAIMPFLHKFINGSTPSDINIYILYFIYLFNTVLSYLLFAYKTSILNAFQRNDIISRINMILQIIQAIIQFVLLIVFKNYYLYVIIQPIITIANNIICANEVKKKYPKYVPKGNVSLEIKADLKKRVAGLFVYKICGTTRNALDSIFISSFLGLTTVAIYNNYYLIMNAIISIMSIITVSMLSGIGNSIVINSVDKNYNDMKKFNFMYMWIAGWCTTCLLCLYQPFMKLWMGQDYMLPMSCVITMCLYFYALKMGDIRAAYSDAAGLWWETRYRAIAESIANCVLNYFLGKYFGLIGIILATLISLLIINFGYGSSIIFKYYFKDMQLSEYYKSNLKYFLITLLIGIITYAICNFFKSNGILTFIIKGIICIVVPNIIYIFVYRKEEMFNESKDFIFNLFDKFKKKVRN